MICWNVGTPDQHRQADRLVEAVVKRGWNCFAHPTTIARLREADTKGLITFPIRSSQFLPVGKLVAVRPFQTK